MPYGGELGPDEGRVGEGRYHGQVGDLHGGPASLEDHDAEHVDEHCADAVRVADETTEYHGERDGHHY